MSDTENRNKRIVQMFLAGWTMAAIGNEFGGISRQRIKQILERQSLTRANGGASLRASQRRNKIRQVRNAQLLKKWGIDIETYKQLAHLHPNPFRAFTLQIHNARNRCIGWDLSFTDWWSIWKISGKWAERGRHRGKYVMSRHNDVGDYRLGNVFIQLSVDNIRDGQLRRWHKIV